MSRCLGNNSTKSFVLKIKPKLTLPIARAIFTGHVPRPAHEKATVTQFLSESNFVIEAYSYSTHNTNENYTSTKEETITRTDLWTKVDNIENDDFWSGTSRGMHERTRPSPSDGGVDIGDDR